MPEIYGLLFAALTLGYCIGVILGLAVALHKEQ